MAEDYTLTGTYEQGKYLRTTDTGTEVANFDWSNVSSSISEVVGTVTNTTASIAEFVWEHPGEVITGAAVTAGAIVLAIYASPFIAVGWLASTATAALMIVNDSDKGDNDGTN